MRANKGKVYLVGAGPGEPRLITVKGLECIRDADVIVYDRLTNERLLEESQPNARKIYVGKESDKHTVSQGEINDLLISEAKKGMVVVRLKGGDPFLFGRGGEEAVALAAAGINFDIVPGVTSATAVPAYAGIPVTHRGLSSSLCIITGHEASEKAASIIAWDKLATGLDTLVFLMGMERLPYIVEHLLANGCDPVTPVAVIQDGAGPRQRTIVGTLTDIAGKTTAENITPPAVVVVGKVVELREKLRWYDNLPLFGKRVLVTRSRHQASKLSDLLLQYGAAPIEMPAISIEPITNNRQLGVTLSRLSEYDWLIFTSANGVEIFFNQLSASGMDARGLKGVKVCAIGPYTAESIKRRGILVDYMPDEFISEGIVDGFKDKDIANKRVLLPRAADVRSELSTGLKKLGAYVDEIPVYNIVTPSNVDSIGRQMLIDGEIDVTTFTSSSTVNNLASFLNDGIQHVNDTIIACIGPVTAAAATDLGLRVDIVAEEHTIPGLVQAIVGYFESTRKV